MLTFEGKRARPPWSLPVRFASAVSVTAYVRSAYRIRSWGPVPEYGEPALVISNHQLDLDLMAIISAMALRGGWRAPFFSASAKMLFEPGFFASRLPWLARLFHDVNMGPLLGGMGLLPIENEIRTRSLARWAHAVQQSRGVLALEDVFVPAVVERHGLAGLRTCDLFTARHFALGQEPARLSELLPAHRREQFEMTARGVEEDLGRIEARLRGGATLYVTPEGEYSRNGKMLPFRAIWSRLEPLAKNVYLAGISYDPFVGRRFSQLYRIVPLSDRTRVVDELKACRPVTTSAMLCAWIGRAPEAFSLRDAVAGVNAICGRLPRNAFVDPEFIRDPGGLTTHAIARMRRFGVLLGDARTGYRLSAVRRHPQFAEVQDIVAYQARFLEETAAGAAPRRAIIEEIPIARRARA